MATSPELLLAYYGDDFTGSTDALESLTRAGARTALFLEPPTPETLRRYPGLSAVGVAGLTRSLAPEAMTAVLRPAFTALRALRAAHVHYKVCSTFDSSPTVGSIGRALDVGAEIFPARFVPLLVGAPALGRYCVFGNLFARMGIGSPGEIHRLDRHPSMSRHPVTPADESDLRRHLARQTAKRTGLFDLLHLALPEPAARRALEAVLSAGAEVVLFDVLDAEQLTLIGALLDRYGRRAQPLFSVGSSGLEMALGAHWQTRGRLRAIHHWPDPGPAKPLLALSGSCSPVTAGQIDHALAHGFTGIAFDPANSSSAAAATAAALTALRAGQNVVVYTSRGDPTRPPLPVASLGTALGQIARTAVADAGVRRLVFAGGDTSSYAARALGLEAVEMIAPLAPGAPLCRAHAPGSPVDGCELNFKGGQVGVADYFTAAARGTLC